MQGYAFCEFLSIATADSTIQSLNGKAVGNKFLTGKSMPRVHAARLVACSSAGILRMRTASFPLTCRPALGVVCNAVKRALAPS